ncbi:MAG TPA: DUF2207 domain-containing protein [Candidatus Dormibacteraeota bacterium]|nr:DUF2207 domain-containing protein [Candidatus Dormibacteraeota bacterium]
MKTRLLLASLIGLCAASLNSAPAFADSGWVINSFHSDIHIASDSSLTITEDIRVDFGAQSHHGIFRYIPLRYRYDDSHDRYYTMTVNSVTDGSKPIPYTVSPGNTELIKIGDPNRTVTGTNRYVITYQLGGVMNSFTDHDELYWNVDGAGWDVPKQSVSATVYIPNGTFQKAACYEGPSGSTEACTFASSPGAVTYTAKRQLSSSEQMSVVTGLNKGAVSVPAPFLETRARSFPADAFDLKPANIAVSLVLLLIGLGLIARYWWLHGRDRAYLGHYYLADDTVHDAPASVFEHDPVVVEFGPPQNFRPAQLGLILDERADKKDVTATIVDLAVRGHLTIKEVDGQKDWLLTWKGAPVEDLLPYEKALLDGLFAGRQQVKISELKGTFLPTLQVTESQIYTDAMSRRLFRIRPDLMRLGIIGVGVVLILAGAGVAYVLGVGAGWGLPGAAIALVGLALIAASHLFSTRTAAGRDLMQHTLGFRLYMTTAEKYRQQFAEKAEIFTQLLPYAIVFGCVNRWAKAFSGIDTTRTNGWYTGTRPFQAVLIANSLESMNSSLTTAISSAPAARGGSGFGGGGFSGGGGGGGGGGAW